MTSQGVLIPTASQIYIYMAPYMSHVDLHTKDINTSPIEISLPMSLFEWATFMQNCKEFFGVNFLSFVMFFAGGISAFHYQNVLKVLGR